MSAMTPVYVNGKSVMVQQEVAVNPGDTLAIGPYLFRSEDSDPLPEKRAA